MWYVHTKEYFAAIKKNWGCSVCSNMEAQKMQRAKQCLESILSFVFVFKDTNVNTCACTEYFQDTHTHRVMMLVGSKREKLMDRGSWTGAADSCFTVYLWNFVRCLYWKLFKRLLNYFKIYWRVKKSKTLLQFSRNLKCHTE